MHFSSIPFRISLKLPSALQSANRTRGRFVAWNMKSDSEKWVEICSINLQKATPLQLFTYFCAFCALLRTSPSTSKKRAGNLIISIFSSLFIYIHSQLISRKQNETRTFVRYICFFGLNDGCPTMLGQKGELRSALAWPVFIISPSFCFLPMLLLNVNTQQNACPFSSPLHIISDMLIHKYYSLIRLTLYSELSSPSFAGWLPHSHIGIITHVAMILKKYNYFKLIFHSFTLGSVDGCSRLIRSSIVCIRISKPVEINYNFYGNICECICKRD